MKSPVDDMAKLTRPQLRDAFNATLKKFKINAKDIAKTASIRNATISEFRSAKRNIQVDNLQAMLDGLPDDAYLYFLQFLSQNLAGHFDHSIGEEKTPLNPVDAILILLNGCKDEDLPELFQAVSNRVGIAIKRAVLLHSGEDPSR